MAGIAGGPRACRYAIGDCSDAGLAARCRGGLLVLLRALQDWFLKFELKTVPSVAEVASVGGMVRQYQVLLDPDWLAAYGIAHTKVVEAIQRANQEAGGSVLELGEAEHTASPARSSAR